MIPQFIYNSNSLEGSSVSKGDTKLIYEKWLNTVPNDWDITKCREELSKLPQQDHRHIPPAQREVLQQ